MNGNWHAEYWQRMNWLFELGFYSMLNFITLCWISSFHDYELLLTSLWIIFIWKDWRISKCFLSAHVRLGDPLNGRRVHIRITSAWFSGIFIFFLLGLELLVSSLIRGFVNLQPNKINFTTRQNSEEFFFLLSSQTCRLICKD